MLEIFKMSYELSANYSHIVPFIWHSTFLEQRLKDEGKVVPVGLNGNTYESRQVFEAVHIYLHQR